MGFEFYSQALNLKTLMGTYLPTNFDQFYSMISEIKQVAGSRRIESIQLLNSDENYYLDRGFFYYFMLPRRVTVSNIDLNELPEILKTKAANSLLIVDPKITSLKLNLPVVLTYAGYKVYQLGDFN